MILRRRDGQAVALTEGAPSLTSQVVFSAMLQPPPGAAPESREYTAAPDDPTPPYEAPCEASDGPTEDSNTMAKEERAPRDYSDAEKRAILEKTRGMGDAAIKEMVRKGTVPISRSSLYAWRKELWGTMNAHGIAMKEAKPTTTNDGTSYTPAEKLRLLKHAEASGNVSKWAADSKISRYTLYEWKRARDEGKLGPAPKTEPEAGTELKGRLVTRSAGSPKIGKAGKPAGRIHGPSGKHTFTAEQKAIIVAEADAHGRKAVAKHYGIHANPITTWKKEIVRGDVRPSRRPGAQAAREPGQRGPGPGRTSLFSREQQQEMVDTVLSLSGADRVRAAAKYGVGVATIQRWSLRLKAQQNGAPPSRALATRSDAELVEAYDAERAGMRAARSARVAESAEMERLKLELLVCKANLQLAIRNGFLSMFDVEGLLTGARRKGDR